MADAPVAITDKIAILDIGKRETQVIFQSLDPVLYL